MTVFGRSVRIILSAVALTAIGAVVLVQFTDYCRLKAVTLDGRPVTDFPSRYPLNPARTIADQPIERVASQLLDEHGIVKVDIDYALPCSLRISTNDFTPDCLVVDKSTGYIYGLDTEGRIIPIKDSSNIWSLPLLTGVRMYRLYSFCDDIRTQLLVPQLHELRAINPHEYEMIEEIDFNNDQYLTVSVSGVPYPVKATADDFAGQMHQFFAFLVTYNPDMSAATSVDLRFAPMIVRVGQPPDSADEDKAGAAAKPENVPGASEAPDIDATYKSPAVNATDVSAKNVRAGKAVEQTKSAENKKVVTGSKGTGKSKVSTTKKPTESKKSTSTKKKSDTKKSTGSKKSGGRG